MCGCKIGSTMKKLKTSVTVTPADMLAFVAGATISAASGSFMTPFTKKSDKSPLDPDDLKMRGRIFAAAKVIGGGYGAMKVKDNMAKAALIGVAVQGGLELVQTFMPDKFDNPFINGMSDYYGYEGYPIGGNYGVGAAASARYAYGVGAAADNFEAVGGTL